MNIIKMNSHEQQLISIKNPFKAYKFAHKHNIWNRHISDKNGFVWGNFLEAHYPELLKFKLKDITQMDYYVLLYILESLDLILNIPVIHYCQIGICSLPKIYEGDHLRIIQAISSLCFSIKIANIIFYREISGPNRGKIQFIFSENEEYKIAFYNEKPNLQKIKNKYCDPTTGIFHTIPNS